MAKATAPDPIPDPAPLVLTPPNTNGVGSTEFTVQQSAKLWGNVGIILGLILAIGPIALGMIPPDSKVVPIVGGLITIAGQVSKILVDLGYLRARTDVKVAQQAAAQTTQAKGDTSTVTVNQK